MAKLKAVLTREESADTGTFGTLVVFMGDARLYTCHTGELPWRDNEAGVSCIPEGEYSCCHYSSEKYPDNYLVRDVPGRDAILIHTGNFCGDRSQGYKSDVEGCILVGEELGVLDGQKAILKSRAAMADLRDAVGKDAFTLVVQGASA